MLKVIQEHYVIRASHSGAGIQACHVEGSGRRRGVCFIAYRTDKMSRWKISAPMSENVASSMLNLLVRNVMRGEGFIGVVHRIKTHQREGIKQRFAAHRAKMRANKELNAIRDLPTFGMF